MRSFISHRDTMLSTTRAWDVNKIKGAKSVDTVPAIVLPGFKPGRGHDPPVTIGISIET